MIRNIESIKNELLITALKAVEHKVTPGGVIGVVYGNGQRITIPFGRYTYEENSKIVKEDTMYDLASITKSIPTNSIALKLIDEGKLKLYDKLIDYIPEFNNSDRDRVMIKHLLTYSLDGYGLASLGTNKMNYNEMYNIIMNKDFKNRPGEIFKYSNVPSFLLGLVIEKITGEKLDILADKMFFKKLGMSHTTFYPEFFNSLDIPPTEINSWYGLVQGHVHDESTWMCKQGGHTVGHSGVFSNAADILNFLEMLLGGGEINGHRYLSESIVKQIETNQIPHLNDFTGLGFELNQPRYMSDKCTDKTFGKTGFTGTLIVCDREKGIAYTLLTNRTYPHRQPDSKAINELRKAVGDILLR